MLSVIIPVKNGSSTLASCLESIVLQKCNFPLEILVIDSGSSDSSIEIAESYGARVLRIKSSDFNHGLTRNYGISEATGKFLFFSVQDATLSDDSILQRMMDWFLHDDIMGVCGHQAVPHDLDKNPLLWFKRFTEPVPEIRKLSLGDPMPSFSWDNVCSMYRKAAFDLLPFEKIDTCEDWIWAYNALNRPLKAAQVYYKLFTEFPNSKLANNAKMKYAYSLHFSHKNKEAALFASENNIFISKEDQNWFLFWQYYLSSQNKEA